MRKRISDSNIFPDFDLFSEYQKIERILSEMPLIGTYDRYGNRTGPKYTLEKCIGDLFFMNWPLRGSFLSLAEMRDNLGIGKDSFTRRKISEEKVLDFLQYAVNCYYRVKTMIRSCDRAYLTDEVYLQAMLDNINMLLDKLGARLTTEWGDVPEFFVEYKDDLAAAVAGEYPELEHSISEYRRIDNRGDLDRKAEILCSLFKRLEPLERKFKGTTYEKLCSDTTFLFNRLGIRHYVEPGKRAGQAIAAMGQAELEAWYDKVYTMFLSCMVLAQYLDMKADIDRLKQSM